MKALLFVPYRQISAAKLAQALDFGALVVEVGDTFDEAFQLLRQIAPELGLYLVNSVNPFRIEGQKTIVAEMMEQRAWRPPDYIVVPGGNLGNASAIGKGLRELKEMGLIEKVPRVIVVQAEGVAVLTGNQLKDTEYVMRHRSDVEESSQRLRVEPSLDALRQALEKVLAVPV